MVMAQLTPHVTLCHWRDVPAAELHIGQVIHWNCERCLAHGRIVVIRRPLAELIYQAHYDRAPADCKGTSTVMAWRDEQ